MGVEVKTISAGDGKNFPKKGDKLAMHYTGTLKSNGNKFDSSRDRGQLFEFTIGVGQVIKGWDEGILKMSLGERATLEITSDFAYGERAMGSAIPANSDLVFDVELVKINGKKLLTQNEFDDYKKRLEAWAEGKLKKYDENTDFKEKRDKKHGDRDGYKAFLDKEVASSLSDAQALLKK
eukprot:CAMPEP_0114505984 /NCGR_PEP_ID=MMETSP0109-20121206/11163_1 /TAXON_ID=29199 /ORGANISM="Chlorarachnion reptans, Strain CCCM449" /LENGTH=178 /DNA_ID=CAMNT_0001684497 /DNA_START=180 /DNA_END=716 /DNA_ORIENTATION=-